MTTVFKRVILSVSGYSVVLVFIAIGIIVYWTAHSKAIEQPIAFSHRIHVSEVGLSCDMCHAYADKTIHAGVPAMEVCMNCHSTIATEKPEIKKLTKYFEDKVPVPWNKVHILPEHVYFSHKRHIKGGLECVNCHGEIKDMDKVHQVHNLNMGWCVTCHKERKAPLDCLVCHK